MGLPRTHWRPFILALAIVGCSLFLTACEDDQSPLTTRIRVEPQYVELDAGATQAFTIYLENGDGELGTLLAQDVVWELPSNAGTLSDPVARDDGAVAVLYTAPLVAGTYHFTVSNPADGSESSDVTVVVRPILVSLDSENVTLQRGGKFEFTATVTGAATPGVTWDVTCGTLDVKGYTATYTAPGEAGECTLTVTSVMSPSAKATATITISPIIVSISPADVTLDAGATHSFIATVTGHSNTAVTWAMTGGTIVDVVQVGGGAVEATYVAPMQAGTYILTATSVADPYERATATITVNPVQIELNSTLVSLELGGAFQFAATVTGAADTSVKWTTSCGTLDVDGATATYTAPGNDGVCTVTAASVAAPSVKATATIIIQPVTVSIAPAAATLDAGESRTFTATVAGHSNTAVTWEASGGTIAGDGSVITYTAPVVPGEYTVTARSVVDPTKSATAIVAVRQVQIELIPSAVTLELGQGFAFTAVVTGAVNTEVTWEATCGKLSNHGASWIAYEAPMTDGTCTVTATSVASPSVEATATVTVKPVSVSVSPTPVTLDAGATQSFTATVTGHSNTAVTWQASGGTISGAGSTVTYTAPLQAGNYTVTARSVVDPTKSGAATITVNPIEIALNSTAVALELGEDFDFVATVTGAANQGVTWDVTCGELDVDGHTATFTAPDTDGECTLTVASVVAPSVKATATITVQPVTVSITPTAVTLDAGATQSFTATVTGHSNTAVTWQASGGTISGAGSTVTYTAPLQAGNYTVTATSVADPTKSATATVTVPQPQVALNATSVELEPGQTFAFSATVTGVVNTAVTWSGGTCGGISATGNSATFTAPVAYGQYGSCTLTATSEAVPSARATATITIVPPGPYDIVVNSTDDVDDGECTV